MSPEGYDVKRAVPWESGVSSFRPLTCRFVGGMGDDGPSTLKSWQSTGVSGDVTGEGGALRVAHMESINPGTGLQIFGPEQSLKGP